MSKPTAAAYKASFPACAGVNRRAGAQAAPRPSPRTQGYTVDLAGRRDDRKPYPARAGVNRCGSRGQGRDPPLPHACGGEPMQNEEHATIGGPSLRMRG